MMYRKVDGIPVNYIHENLQALRWVTVKPSHIASRTKTKINIKSVVSCMIDIIYVIVLTGSTCDDKIIIIISIIIITTLYNKTTIVITTSAALFRDLWQLL